MTMTGVTLADLTWVEAEPILAAGPLVVLPLGAGSKEHGPHLRLDNDQRTVEFLAGRLRERLPIVVAPTITFHHYPAFVEYPGSISLRLETARDLVVDICRSLAAFGPRRFYVLNYGVSTIRALAPAAEMLAGDGILLRYTVLATLLSPINGSIITDKFCLSRAGRLRLSWPRARVPHPSSWPRAYPPDEVTHCGGGDEATVAGAADRRRDGDRAAAVGPGVPAPPGIGDAAAGGGSAVVGRPRGGDRCA